MWYFWASVTSLIGGLPWCFEQNCSIWLLAREWKWVELLVFGSREELQLRCLAHGQNRPHQPPLAPLRPSPRLPIPQQQADCTQGRNCFRIFEREQCDCMKPSDLSSAMSMDSAQENSNVSCFLHAHPPLGHCCQLQLFCTPSRWWLLRP